MTSPGSLLSRGRVGKMNLYPLVNLAAEIGLAVGLVWCMIDIWKWRRARKRLPRNKWRMMLPPFPIKHRFTPDLISVTFDGLP